MNVPEDHYDAVVVGSGFGGSVAAYRLAEANRRVLVLERGKAYPPGSFPRTPGEMAGAFWDPSEGRHGMFDFWSFRGAEALVAAGLGGGSLIYANVLLRKDENWFVRDAPDGENWPVTRKELDPHYDRAEEMLAPQFLPVDDPDYPEVPKVRAMRQAAATAGHRFDLVPLAVTFRAPGADRAVPGEPITGENLHGRTRLTCRLTGECDIGCNYGSKNTLDYTYLSEAVRLGAEIRTRCEVRSFEPDGRGGYLVGYVEHTPEREGARTQTRRLPVVTVRTDRLVLAAGTLGTTFLLLRNRSAFPHLSRRLGTRFSGNGDLLTFVTGSREWRDGRRVPRVLAPSFGPVITGALRVPDVVDGGRGRGFYIEDGGAPQGLDWLLGSLPTPRRIKLILAFVAHRLRARITEDPRSDVGGEIGRALGAPHGTWLPLLGMGRDKADGTMRLRGGFLDVRWTTRTSEEYFHDVRATMKRLARALGGRHHDTPLWLFKRIITVHALGGCPMGEHEGSGVVDPYGRVFNYPGLFVADGSVMPGPVGANPSLTIAALADRFADRMVEDQMREGTGA